MATAPAPDSTYDPYAEKPSFWRTHANAVAAVAVFISTIVLIVFSAPPYRGAELGYVLAVPGLYWAYFKPKFRFYFATLFAAHAVAWTIQLNWLHHVTWGGLLLLGPLIGLWVSVWYIAVWWTMPRMITAETGTRILAMFGLAGLWVVIEWTRTWLLTGFPWLPLAATQWERPALLQIASYTGAAGVSFMLAAFNVGFAAYGHRLLREKHQGLRKRSPEFMAALMCLMLPTFYLIYSEMQGQQREPLARVAVVQPDIPQTVKWDASQSDFIFNTLGGLTARAARTWPDLILWPEASTPHAVKGDVRVQRWVEELVKTCGVPLLLGSIAFERHPDGRELWQNAALVVDPKTGLDPNGYAKQHLVPFGEYVPLRPILGWLEKFVPIGGDFQPGEASKPIVVTTVSRVLTVGPLICYEDIFPGLARDAANSGAEMLAVLTNNAWYGTGTAAYQHAAHSVLRAVEVRRPVVRCGNNGWSGWIDEFGNIRHVMKNSEGTVYFRGTDRFEVTRDARWAGRQSFYSRFGDWFVGVCAALTVMAYLTLAVARKREPAEPTSESSTS
jgi:apolipoprotein N-acyltransferase